MVAITKLQMQKDKNDQVQMFFELFCWEKAKKCFMIDFHLSEATQMFYQTTFTGIAAALIFTALGLFMKWKSQNRTFD